MLLPTPVILGGFCISWIILHLLQTPHQAQIKKSGLAFGATQTHPGWNHSSFPEPLTSGIWSLPGWEMFINRGKNQFGFGGAGPGWGNFSRDPKWAVELEFWRMCSPWMLHRAFSSPFPILAYIPTFNTHQRPRNVPTFWVGDPNLSFLQQKRPQVSLLHLLLYISGTEAPRVTLKRFFSPTLFPRKIPYFP